MNPKTGQTDTGQTDRHRNQTRCSRPDALRVRYQRGQRNEILKKHIRMLQVCNSGNVVCNQKTVSTTFMHKQEVSRSCEQICVEIGEVNDEFKDYSVCCQRDLCNAAVKSGNTQLPVAAALLFSIVVVDRLIFGAAT